MSIEIDSESESVDSNKAPPLPPRPVTTSIPMTTQNSSNSMDVEDGPLFRATIKQLENKTSQLKSNLKRIIKSAQIMLDMHHQFLRTEENYIESLRETQCIEPLMSYYLNNTYDCIQEERKKLDKSLSLKLIEPLKQLYENDLKNVEIKKRQFEEESKEYYNSLAKYLKSNKSTTEKHNLKKSKFDLARFDYMNFLLDLHGGKRENDILFFITDHTIRNIDYYENISNKIQLEKTGLNQLLQIMTETSKEQDQIDLERALKRQELLANITTTVTEDTMMMEEEMEDPTSLQRIPSTSGSSTQEENNTTIDLEKFKGIRDLDQYRASDNLIGRKKEGFLFATSKPSKSTGFDVTSTSVTWHKYWCVLSGGQLHEYSNWKRQLEPHIDPINLRFATVREARNSERKFCFEVITPQLRRIYQATSQEEATSWINTIHNSIESLLNGTSNSSANLIDVTPSSSTPTKRHGRSLSGALKSSLAVVATNSKERKRQSAITFSNTQQQPQPQPSEGAELLVSASASPNNDRFRWSGFSFGSHHHQNKPLSTIQQTSNNNGNYVFSSIPDSTGNTRLLSILRQDNSNHYCADCGAINPDWCSLNLGVLLCIECSGIHRSLGTHVSKIRSLTLDSTSYTPDIIELLKSIGNAKSNAIWDSRFEQGSTADTTTIPRPNPTDSRTIKLNYIQAKYVNRSFVKKVDTNPDDLLFEAIDVDDIPKALLALASGANVNSFRADFKKSPRISLFINNSTSNGSLFSMEEDATSSNKLQIQSSEKDYIVRYALHYALLHGRSIESNDKIFFPTSPTTSSNESSNSMMTLEEERITTIFPMAELLLQNGADTSILDPETGHTLAELFGMGSIVDDHAIAYINLKNTARGQSTIIRDNNNIPPPLPKKDLVVDSNQQQ